MVRTELAIASGTTETVASGVTQDTATVSNAGTFSNAGTNTAGGQELTTTAIDIDASTGIFARSRDLTTLSPDTLTVASGTTQTVASDETLRRSIANAGTVENKGTVRAGIQSRTRDVDGGSLTATRLRELDATATDIDIGTTDMFAGHFLGGTATDVDTAPIQLTRLRALTSTATDIDAADSTLLRERSLVATGTDVDTAIAPLFVVRFVESTRAVEAVEEVLDAPNGHWRHEEPDVQFYWNSTQSERGNGADQPADVYVWSPTGTTHERFSLDSDKGRTDDTTDVEILVYSLDEFEVMEYAEDIALLLEEYFDDNKDLTNFTTIEPVATRDYREQTNHRATDHYVAGVEVELRTLSPATRRG